MNIIYLLLPLSILLGATFLLLFVWGVKKGQYEDLKTPKLSILIEDEPINKNHLKDQV